MNIRNVVMTFAAFGFLAACQTANSGSVAKSASGAILGKNQWGTIGRSQSNVAFVGDDSVIAKREANYLPSRVVERMRLKSGGILMFEELYGSYFGSVVSAEEYLVNNAARGLSNFGLGIGVKDVKKTDFQETFVYYATKGDALRTCFVFNSNFGDIAYGEGDRHMFGRVCRFNKDIPEIGLEKTMLALLDRARFGEEAEQINQAKGDTASTTSGAFEKRAFSAKWEGYAKSIVGEMELRQNGRSGSMALMLPNNGGRCNGDYRATDKSTGVWKLTCANGKSANGVMRTKGPGAGATGSGTDSDGRKVTFTVEAR